MASDQTRPDRVWAIRPCVYGATRRERGEVFALDGLPTDQRLIDELYVQALRPQNARYSCPRCDKEIVSAENMVHHLEGKHGRPREEAIATANGLAPIDAAPSDGGRP